MGKILNQYFKSKISIAISTLLLLFYGCASVQQPTGGPKDKQAPKVLSENPKNFSRNFLSTKIEIEFDEYFKLSNEFKEISISPAMDKNPEFKVKKKILEITFQDTLEKNTTYTINFGKGIVDYNEGNILKNYSYVFATGNVIDSLSISGTVVNSITNKPELEATVFILPTKQDSLFGKKRASLFTTTDSSGNFSLHNLRQDTYRIYALKEQGGDRIYNSTTEEIAFQKDTILLNRNITNINLRTFKEEPSSFRVIEKKILSDGHLLFTFNKALVNPSIQILSPQLLNTQKKTEFSKQGDTALVWLPEIAFDSINVAVQSEGKNLDTLTIRRNKKDTYTAAVIITDNVASSKIRQRSDIVLTLSAPVTTADMSKIILLEDSVSRNFQFIKDTTSLRKYRISYQWRSKKQYILSIRENAFTSIMNGKNKPYSKQFTLDPDENYSSLSIDISVPDTSRSYIVQLMRGENEVLKSTSISTNRLIEYTGYSPGKYAIRIIYDTNKNGKWDTGNVKGRIQPEKIWNYPTEYTLRPNFNIEKEKITIPAE